MVILGLDAWDNGEHCDESIPADHLDQSKQGQGPQSAFSRHGNTMERLEHVATASKTVCHYL